MIHLIVGDAAADNLRAACALDENLKGEIFVLKDTLGIGPIATDEKGHDGIRTTFWRHYLGDEFEGSMDEHNLQKIKETARENEEPVCLWMAPCVTDVCAYYYLLTQFKEEKGMFHIINIDSLPFLNEKGGVFYPKNFSEVLPKEFIKTKRLLKEVTPADYETDGEEWERMQNENTMVRIHKGGKEIQSENETYYDQAIYNAVSKEEQKGSKIIRNSFAGIEQTVSDIFLLGRLQAMVSNGQVVCTNQNTKDPSKALFKKAGGHQEVESENDSNTDEV